MVTDTLGKLLLTTMLLGCLPAAVPAREPAPFTPPEKRHNHTGGSRADSTAGSREQDSPVSSNAGRERRLSKNRIVSPENPAIVIDVSKQLRSVGVLKFPLKKVAQVERYIFASTDAGGRALRLFIAQFESVLPGVKGGYSFPSTNATLIGRHDYQTQVGFFNFAQTISANPGAEAEHTRAFLDRNGVLTDDDFLVARYARVASEDKRHELILFYYEGLRGLGLARADLEQGGSRAQEAAKVFAEFAERARKSFKVVDGNISRRR